jgi:hypothetical protein
MNSLKVAIIDSGTDLKKLYGGDRHGYEAVWVSVEQLSFVAISDCHLLIIPAGSDTTLLAAKRDCLQHFQLQGGWIFCFDGAPEGLLEDVAWSHSPTDYRNQRFFVPQTDFASLFDGVDLEGLAVKDGVRGWWSEGELLSNKATAILTDQSNRTIACIVPRGEGKGGLVATAVGRLPLFSADPCVAANVLFRNLVEMCRPSKECRAGSRSTHVYIHSGNWAHRSFLESDRFRDHFAGVHWACVDESILQKARSAWIPWESNCRALKTLQPLLAAAVAEGTTLVIEDLRDDWLPGHVWQQRPVDSSWWRDGRRLDLEKTAETARYFPSLTLKDFSWHYHGVFDHPQTSTPLLTTADGKAVLTHSPGPSGGNGGMLVSTLDATFEYGAGKIPQTAPYIEATLRYLAVHSG